MNKKTAGERKRTVTITLGEKTWKLLLLLTEKQMAACNGVQLAPTSVAASVMGAGFRALLPAYEIKDDRRPQVCSE